MKEVHRFEIGNDGEILEIIDPIEFKLDSWGRLEKAVWISGKGVKTIIEWDEKTKRYTILETVQGAKDSVD